MSNKYFPSSYIVLGGFFAFTLAGSVSAQSTSDDFTLSSDSNSWKTFGGACLTAGDGTGSIPACVGLPYYSETLVGGVSGSLPDSSGNGALRFTNGYPGGYSQAGALISSTPFPMTQGLQVIFKTVSYRGDSGGTGDGADGIGFFLMDGSYPAYDVGAYGGSLGYTCSNSNNDSKLRADGTVRGYDGLAGGYLGLGLDEYGNFLNAGDNTATGYGYLPGRIGLRGAGSITWAELNKSYPAFYPGSLTTSQRAAAVQKTCSTGVLWNYSHASSPVVPATSIADYSPIAGSNVTFATLYPGKLIANESALKRPDATPITYSLKITQDGFLSLAMSYNGGNYINVLKKQAITSTNGALPASFRFGFTGSTGGSTNIHEIMCFQAAPSDLGDTSVGINAKEATRIASGTQAYLAYYYPSTWTGRLTASDILFDSATNSISVAAVANWDADCNLTGVPSGQKCPTTGNLGPTAPQAPAPAGSPPSRSMITWNGSQGIPFEWASLSNSQKSVLTLGDGSSTANRLNYLRGDRSNELTSFGVGLYRIRDSVLGDIVGSSPTWVGPPEASFAHTWLDKLPSAVDPTPENSGPSYSQFVNTAQTRLNVVYSGSNDGFLHGFRSGSFDSSHNFVNNSATPNDGEEILAYMPGAVLQTIHNSTDTTLDFSHPQYSHNFFVDGTPDAEDLYYGAAWHTWLVGGLGAGGAAIYALDITDPTQFSETHASGLVIGEWSSSTISCVSNGGCGASLGNTYGTPVIRRLHDGKWAIIFGNGFNSASGAAGIFIMTVNPSTGTIDNKYYLDTGVSGSNGIAFVTPVDLDGDSITDFVYAGDLLGNIWRFDLTSSSENAWAVSGPALFTAVGQPIASKLLVTAVKQTAGAPRVMVEFGTGRKIPQTNTAPAVYDIGVHHIYGIWDWNLGNWNLSSGTQLAALAGPHVITDSSLQIQTLTVASDGVSRDISNNPIAWCGTTVCTVGNTQFGFIVTLPSTNEQIIYNPLLYQNAFVVNTTIPAYTSPNSCQITHDTGYTIAISTGTGGIVSNKAAFFKNTTDSAIAGENTNGIGTPIVVLAGGGSFLLTQSLGGGTAPNGGIKCTQNAAGSTCSGQIISTTTGKRLTWVERR